MKKFLATLVAVIMVLTMLSGCLPNPEPEEAEEIARGLLDKVIGVFKFADYELNAYSDGTFYQYVSGYNYYYLVNNFLDIFSSDCLTAEAMVSIKDQLGLLITPVDGTFIRNAIYDLYVDSLFTGNYEITVDQIEDIEIFCTVACEYYVAADSEEVTVLYYPMVVHCYAREVEAEDGKTETEYYWLISEMFNPLNPSAAIDPDADTTDGDQA